MEPPLLSDRTLLLSHASVQDFSSVTMSWPLPSIKEQYRSKPYRYVSHVLGHEGEGSLLSLLKVKTGVCTSDLLPLRVPISYPFVAYLLFN